MSLYSLDLANLETSQPDLQNILTEGGFGVNRTGKSFASVPLDMALKQTINANAESRLKGIMVFADISTAENRWIVTASMKSNILHAVLDCADMSISCDESKELRASRIRAEQNHLSKLNKVIKVTLNPFSKQPNKDFLFNLKTGTQASKDVEKYLLTLLKCGNEREIYLHLNVAAHLNDLLNLFARQELLPFLARVLKETNQFYIPRWNNLTK